MSVGPLEILLILLVVVFLAIGPRRIVDLARALGRGARDFKNEFGGDERERELPGEDDEEEPTHKR